MNQKNILLAFLMVVSVGVKAQVKHHNGDTVMVMHPFGNELLLPNQEGIVNTDTLSVWFKELVITTEYPNVFEHWAKGYIVEFEPQSRGFESAIYIAPSAPYFGDSSIPQTFLYADKTRVTNKVVQFIYVK